MLFRSSYTLEMGIRVCEAISESQMGIKKLCLENDWMPSATTIKKWVREDAKENETDKEGFATLYARAKDEQADSLVEEMLDIADDKTKDTVSTEFGESGNAVAVARARLQIDTRKFIAAKLKPKKYGDKLDLTSLGEKINQVPVILTKQDVEALNKDFESKF